MQRRTLGDVPNAINDKIMLARYATMTADEKALWTARNPAYVARLLRTLQPQSQPAARQQRPPVVTNISHTFVNNYSPAGDQQDAIATARRLRAAHDREVAELAAARLEFARAHGRLRW